MSAPASPPAPIAVTFFGDPAAASKREQVLDLAKLAKLIETTTGPAKGSLPWLKLARFGDVRSAKGSLRHDANLLAISGVEADYDAAIMGVDEAVERLGAAGVLAIVYTSPSHTDDTPRWRVLCPLSTEYLPEHRDRFLARLNGLFGGAFAGKSWTRSQSYYYGSVNRNPSHRVELLDGTPIDLVDELDMFAMGKPGKANGANGAYHGPATPPEAITDKRMAALFQSLLDNISAAQLHEKHTALWNNGLAIGGRLHLSNWSDGDAIEACMAALAKCNSEVESWPDARKTAAEAIAAGRLRPMPLEDRPGHARRRPIPPPAPEPATAPETETKTQGREDDLSATDDPIPSSDDAEAAWRGTDPDAPPPSEPGDPRPEPPPEPPEHRLPVIPWIDEKLSDWARRPLPQRGWIVPEWIPRGQATGLYGIGGIHKTNWLIQLLLAKSHGLIFMEYKLEAGPVYGLFCEDTSEEIIRRATRIAKDAWPDANLTLADFPDFHFASLVGVQGKELATFDKSLMETPPTEALIRLDQKIVAIGATLVTLDTLPHFFGGNEVVRREVTQFVTQLDAISIGRNCGLLFTAHPSASGKRSGNLDSGSTGWEGSVRARLTLRDPGPIGSENPDEPIPEIASDRRILKRAKSNYAKAGEEIEFVVREGVFFLVGTAEAPGSKFGPEHDAACDAKFLELLAAVTKQGSYVNDTHNSRDHYAPKVFSRSVAGADFKPAEYQRAIERLYYAGRLKLIDFGPPSKAQRKFIDTQAAPDAAALKIVPATAAAPQPPPPPPTQADIDAAVAHYLTLDDVQRELARRRIAKRLYMRVGVFEQLAKAAIRPVETVGEDGNVETAETDKSDE